MKEYGVWKKDENGDPAGLDAAVRKYNRAVKAIDEGVGRLIDVLRKTDQLNDTLIVYTSDQGPVVGGVTAG